MILDDLVGLAGFKVKIEQLELKFNGLKSESNDNGLVFSDTTMHLVFTGNPGTGKTSAARLLAHRFKSIGLLARDHVREIAASSVMSSNIGETRENMQREIENALGGVLFIDEAHQFGDKNSPQAREAIQALVPMAWNHRHELVIILAGYEDGMNEFYAMDEGLVLRFPEFGRIHFPDYSHDELSVMVERKLQQHGYSIAPDTKPAPQFLLHRRMQKHHFGNAGGVDNLLAELMQNRADSPDESLTISLVDVPPALRRDDAIYETALQEILQLIGSESVKQKLREILDGLKYDSHEIMSGQGNPVASLHPGNMIFVGPSGTGKSKVAQLITDALFGLGCIDRRICLSVSRSDLVGEYIGQSATSVRSVVGKARGGVLFIDEADSLCGDAQDVFGREALSELISQLTIAGKSDAVCILSGRDEGLQALLKSNRGLERRFPILIQFQNLTPNECVQLASQKLTGEHFVSGDGVLEEIGRLAAEAIHRDGDNFGNALWVQDLTSQALSQMKSRIVRSQMSMGDSGRRCLLIQDLSRPI